MKTVGAVLDIIKDVKLLSKKLNDLAEKETDVDKAEIFVKSSMMMDEYVILLRAQELKNAI